MADSKPVANSNRIAAIDAARGLALIAMTIFHFIWDLDMFGVIERGFAASEPMKWFARIIASSFLALVGVSLVLGHGNGIKWGGFWKRFIMVAGAAAAITIATYFAIPKAFIFFGILHHIALASLLGLAFLRLPFWVNVIAGACVLIAYFYTKTPLLDAPIWWWTGLQKTIPTSNDYVPMAPFFSMVLFGIAFAQLAGKTDFWQTVTRFELASSPMRALRFIGRHSLIYYLIHQPVMIGVLYGVNWIVG